MKKIVGIVYAYDAQDEYAEVRACGFEWIRIGIPFPWQEAMNGSLSPRYQQAKEACRRAKASGLKLMGATFGLGCYRFDPSDGESSWRDEIPAFVGKKGTEAYYDRLREAAAFMAKDLHGLIDGLWQCMNEIDNPTFAGPYSADIAADTARAIAKGIVEADPEAMCGINLSRCCDEALSMADQVYRPGHAMRYVGDDQYFGSWQGKTVEAWYDVIETIWARYHLPILANEWGFSGGGSVKSVRPDPSVLKEGWTDVCHEKSWFHAIDGGHTEETQAAYIARGLEIFAQHPHVIGSFLFCWKDARHCYHCGQSDCPAECYWGIVDTDRKPKPAYDAAKSAIERLYR